VLTVTKNGFSGICKIKILGILNRAVGNRQVYPQTDATGKAKIDINSGCAEMI